MGGHRARGMRCGFGAAVKAGASLALCLALILAACTSACGAASEASHTAATATTASMMGQGLLGGGASETPVDATEIPVEAPGRRMPLRMRQQKKAEDL